MPAATTVELLFSRFNNDNTTSYWNGGAWMQGSAVTFRADQLGLPGLNRSWAYTFNAANWQSDMRYNVKARAYDDAKPVGNMGGWHNAGLGYDFIIDTTPPNSQVNMPVDGSTYRTMTQISGTANADMAGVASVGITIQRIAGTAPDGNYWSNYLNNWVGYSTSCPANVTQGPGTKSWTYAIADSNWTSGTRYRIVSQVRDLAGNAEILMSTATFVFDNSAPQVSVQAPVSPFYGPSRLLDTITGTAADNPSPGLTAGVDKVFVRIKQGANQYWSGTGWVASSSWVVVSGGINWTYPSPAWADGASYVINARAVDLVGNLSGWTTSTFLWDQSLPQVVLQRPVNDFEPAPLSLLSGTAYDPGSAGQKSYLDRVEIAIQVNPATNGNYWSGSSFNTSDIQWLPTSANALADGIDTVNPWTFTGSTPTWLSGTSYQVSVHSVDKANNTSTAAAKTFIFDNIAPTTKLTTPPGDVLTTRQNTMTSIIGTAADTAPGLLNRVEIRIKHTSSGYYWNPATQAFEGLAADSAWFIATTTVTPAYTVWNTTQSITTLSDGTQYQIVARALDMAGNYHVAYTTANFVYDISPARSYVTVPGANSTMCQLPSMSGTAVDAAGGSVTLVKVAVRNNRNGKWWGGSDFTEPTPLYLDALGTNPWGFDCTAAGMTAMLSSGSSYYIVTQAWDNALNTEAYPGNGPVTFIWDVTSPTSTVVVPVNGSSYNALATITGAVADVLPFAGATPSAINKVQVAVQDLTYPTTYWSFATGWLNTAQWNDAVTYQSSWTFANIPLWQSGRFYGIRSRAFDSALPLPGNDQNTQWPQSNYVILFDSIPPQAAMTSPVNNAITNTLPLLTGTAQDLPSVNSGIDKILVAVREIDPVGNWYNPATSSFTYAGATPPYSTATWISAGAPHWELTCPALRDGYQYFVQVYGRDNAGNNGAVSSPSVFRYDVTPPVAALTYPYKSWHVSLPTISGTAADNGYTGSSVASILVTYQDNPPGGLWYDGVTFSKGTMFTATWVSTGIVGAPNWTESQTPAFSNNRWYQVAAKAVDLAGNESLVASQNFRLDNVPPLSAVTQPATGKYYNAVSAVTGTAFDADSGIDKLQVRIFDVTSNLSWFGASQGWKDNGVYGSSWVAVSNVYASSWSYTDSVGYATGKTYRITSQAQDVAGSNEAPGDIPAYDTEFYYDNSTPQSVITLPSQPGSVKYYRQLPVISGTSLDQPAVGASGISMVEVAVENKSRSGANWWGGADYNQATSGWAVAAGTMSWTYSFNNWTDGNAYLVLSRAYDKTLPAPGLIENSFAVAVNSVTFVCDTSSPTSTISWPPSNNYITNTLSSISGTTIDALSGVSVTKVGIKLNNGGWWNGTDFTGAEAYFNSSPLTSGNTSWAYGGFAAGLVDQSTFTVFAVGYDNALPAPGNYETVLSSVTFIYDITRPTSTITVPSNLLNTKTLPTISGTAFDTFGVASVNVLVRDLLYPATYWQSGATWGPAITWHPAAYANGSWTMASPAFTDGHSYELKSMATDTAGNPEIPGLAQTATFSYDTTPPDSNVAYPVNGHYYPNPTIINGTASDTFTGIASVSVIIKQVNNTNYWNGSSWVPGVEQELPTTWNNVAGTWSRSTGLPVWADATLYQIQSKAYDKAGNVQITPLHPGSTWYCEQSGPTSGITLPVMPQREYNSLPVVSGTANDSFGINMVELRVFDISTGETWDETVPGWVAGDQDIWNLATGASTSGGTISWTYPKGSITWLDNRNYRLSSRAQNVAGTFETGWSSNTFKCDISSPTAYVSVPANNAIISSLPTISGKVYDASNTTLVRMGLHRLSDNHYWTFDGWTGSQNWENAAGGGTGLQDWTYTHASFADGSAFQTGVTYAIDVEARDNTLPAKNISTLLSTCTFIFDNQGPLTGISAPADGGSYNASSIGAIFGTSYDSPAGPNHVLLSVHDLSGAAGRYFSDDGAGGATWLSPVPEYWIAIASAAAGGVTVQWSYNQPALSWTDGHFYTVRAQGVDNIGNAGAVISSATFIYDMTKPTSTITDARKGDGSTVSPLNNAYIEDIRYIEGTAQDPIPPALNASGVPSGGVQYCIIMESNTPTYENGIPDANFDYQWNGSTWTLFTGAYNWRTANGGISWFSEDMTGKWYSGRWYLVKARAIDRAGNVQDDTIMPWTRFAVTLPAKTFNVTVNNLSPVAGQLVSATVEAKDANGDRARNYQGRIRFSVDGLIASPGGPEMPNTGGVYQAEEGWLPSDYYYTSLGQGIHTFNVLIATESLKLVKGGAGNRVLHATDIDDNSITGQVSFNVAPAAAEKLRVLVPGTAEAPGVVGGISGSVIAQTAGTPFTVTAQAVDKYWNINPSAVTTVRLSATDPYASPLTQVNTLTNGTTTYDIALMQRGYQNLTVTDTGASAWTSQTTPLPVQVNAALVNKLMVLLPNQTPVWGKPPYDPPFSDGGRSTTTVMAQTAGAPFTVTVYAVDRFWNKRDDTAASVLVETTDPYDVEPSTRPLSNGSTTFTVTLITSATQYVSSKIFSGPVVSSGTSNGVYVQPTTAENLQVLVPGETAIPGKANLAESKYFGQSAPFGKTGTPSNLTAGTTYAVTVNLVDRYFNVVPNASMPEITMNIAPYAFGGGDFHRS